MRVQAFLLLFFSPLLTAASASAQPVEDVAYPAFVKVPALSSGFRELYIQKFPEGRAQFEAWESQHPNEPFGQVAIAASYLFEEFYRQGVLSSDFFLNEKKFLHGIDGEPNATRMQGFEKAVRSRTTSRAAPIRTPVCTATIHLKCGSGTRTAPPAIMRR